MASPSPSTLLLPPLSSVADTTDEGPSSQASASTSSNIKPQEEDDTNTNEENQSTTTDDDKKDESIFECNICLDTAKDAVVSMCGHLFCWPCLHQWLETRPSRQLCPVCKAAISKEKVIPLYGRGSTNQEDPRTKVPPRPAGQRVEPEPASMGFQGFGYGDGGFHMSFGIGAFPFGFFTSSFNFNEVRPPRKCTAVPLLTLAIYLFVHFFQLAANGAAQYDEDQFLSKAFLWATLLFMAWLILA